MTTVGPPNGEEPTPLRVGGRYEVNELLGRGGMAEVRRGSDLRLGRTVAIKRLRTDLASDTTFQARFRREAQSAASLNHPAIVAVYDTGEEPSPDGSAAAIPYIVMEYIEGRTLRDILRDGRKILPERALEITADVLAALDYSHRAGIIHRDIKPANVMLTPSGDVKVMDFGIARAIADSSATMTQTAAVVGTAQYLSPEQARGEQVDARSDIYSTGCLLYELLTGRPPFVGDSPVAVAYQHVREEPAPPSSIDPEVSPELDAILGKALAKSLSERYQSAAEMRADIERALAGRPVAAPTLAAVPAVADQTGGLLPLSDSAEETGVVAEEEEKKRGRRWLWALLAVLLVLLVALGFLFLPGLLAQEEQPQAAVPTVTDGSLRQARNEIERAGLRVGDVQRRPNDTAPQGRVLEQDPAPGEVLDEGSRVDLVVSSGPRMVAVEFVIGQKLRAARQTLSDQGLNVQVERVEADAPRNEVVSTDPEAGERVETGTVVTLSVSEGLQKLPRLVDRSEDEAISILEGMGLDYETIPDPSAEQEAGIVVRQFPEAGTRVESDTTVTLVVSTRPEEETTTPETTTPETTTPETTPEGDGETESPPDGEGLF